MAVYTFPASSTVIVGAATEEKQDDQIVIETAIQTNTTNLNNTIAAEGASQPTHGLVVMGHTGAGVVKHLRADTNGKLSVNVDSSTLPTGAATETTLSTLNTKVPSNLTVTSNRLVVDGSGVTQPVSGTFWQATQPVSAASLPLPTGASTETTLAALNTKIPSSLTVTSTRLLVDPSGVTSPVSAASLPLPTGAASEATLAAIATQLPSSLGVKTAANSLSITPASDASFSFVPGALAPTFQEILNLTTSAQTFTAPAGVKWCKVYADDTNAANIRVKIGGTATTTSGIQFQPGRSEDYTAVGNISVIAESGTNQKICVQFGA